MFKPDLSQARRFSSRQQACNVLHRELDNWSVTKNVAKISVWAANGSKGGRDGYKWVIKK